MIRRLIRLMAMEIVLAPLFPRDMSDPLRPLAPGPGRPSLSFSLTETVREPCRRHPNPDRVPDTPQFNRAFFLDRLAVLADVYRARARLARRLARRVQTGRARLNALPLPKRLYDRTLPAFKKLLDFLGELLSTVDSS